jgi:hypothetical protein
VSEPDLRAERGIGVVQVTCQVEVEVLHTHTRGGALSQQTVISAASLSFPSSPGAIMYIYSSSSASAGCGTGCDRTPGGSGRRGTRHSRASPAPKRLLRMAYPPPPPPRITTASLPPPPRQRLPTHHSVTKPGPSVLRSASAPSSTAGHSLWSVALYHRRPVAAACMERCPRAPPSPRPVLPPPRPRSPRAQKRRSSHASP